MSGALQSYISDRLGGEAIMGKKLYAVSVFHAGYDLRRGSIVFEHKVEIVEADSLRDAEKMTRATYSRSRPHGSYDPHIKGVEVPQRLIDNHATPKAKEPQTT